MIQHMLVPTDGSENAERALRLSAQFIDQHQQAEITVIHVHLFVHSLPPMIAPTPAPTSAIPLEVSLAANEKQEKAAQERAQHVISRAVEEMRQLLPSPAIPLSGQVVISDHVDESIVQVAQETQADLIVVGTRGVGTLRGALLGSVSHALIARAECPVLIVK